MVTDEQNKIKTRRKNTYIGIWNIRTLREEGKLEELTHELDKYRWTVVVLSEVRRKGVNEIQTTEGHKLYYIGNDNKHINGVGFLINSEVTRMIMCFTPINDIIAIIRLHATPFNISIIQVYAPTTYHTDEETEIFYNDLQNSISKKYIMVIQGDMNANISKDAHKNWGSTSGIFCNSVTNERGYRLLEFAQTNELKIVNTFGPHKKSRIQTWHSPGGIYHNQIDYILVSKRFSTSMNINKTRSLPGADIGSDHDMLMMTFCLHLKNPKKNKFDLEKLKNPETKKLFEKKLNEKLTEQKLTVIENTEEMLQQLNRTMTERATEILGKYRKKKKKWITN